MNVEIACSLYARMVIIPLAFEVEYGRSHLKAVLLERKNNQLFMVVTNTRIAAVEHIGVNHGQDASVTIIATEQLRALCESLIPADGKLSIAAMPGFGASISTMFGKVEGNALVVQPADSEFNNWRKWWPDALPTASKGVMYWAGDEISRLADASPSGGLKFPGHIDTAIPVVVNDMHQTNWCGLFPCKHPTDKMTATAIPGWLQL